MKAYEDGQAALAQANSQIAAAEQEINNGKPQLAAAKTQLDQGKEQLAAAKVQLDNGKAELAAAKAQLNAGQQQLSENVSKMNELKETLTEQDDVEQAVKSGVAPVSYTHLDVYKRQVCSYPGAFAADRRLSPSAAR